VVALCDGAALLRVLEAAATRFEREVEEIDALNVYPLPDGDTGRNMRHTIGEAVRRARAAEPTASGVAAAAAHGALMGARGNSGVILSQMIRGLKDAFAGKSAVGPADLRHACELARSYAYGAVEKPAEGTMLSCCAEMQAALDVSADDPIAILRCLVENGVAAVERTMGENAMNDAAGVVDAGAYGLWVLLDGALDALDPLASVGGPVLRRAGVSTRVAATARPLDVAAWTGGHCVQFLVSEPSSTAEELRSALGTLGADSVLVVGDASLLKVHVHAVRPEAVLEIGRGAGRVDDVLVEDLDELVAEHERATGIVLRSPSRPLAVLSVVPGEGLAAVARSLGAVVLLGGATMNPSVGELADAVKRANAGRVVLLPNDPNVILAARQAATLGESVVDVVPTRNVAQGMAALVAFDDAKSAEAVVAAMEAAARAARGIEVTRATREMTVEGLAVREGDAIALLDGKLVASGSDEVAVLADAASRLERVELLTLYVGAGVDAEQAALAARRLREACEGAEVEVIDGGQPHYPFLVAAE